VEEYKTSLQTYDLRLLSNVGSGQWGMLRGIASERAFWQKLAPKAHLYTNPCPETPGTIFRVGVPFMTWSKILSEVKLLIS